MHRSFTVFALTAALLAGCSNLPGPQKSGLYHAPSRAYSLALDSAVFRGAVTLTEQCDAKGGSLNIYDSSNRFFRIDYLKIGQHPMADVPSFASERTIAEKVLGNYLRDVLPNADRVAKSDPLLREYVDTGRGDGMFGVVSLDLKASSLPEGITSTSYYYGFLVFTRGDMVYVLQHRVDTYQPDKLKQILSSLRQDMLVPGTLRLNSDKQRAAPTDPAQAAKGPESPDSIQARCG